MKKELVAELEETTIELLAALSLFTQDEFDKIPFEGSWSAGQVAEHLFKSESNIPKVLNGNSKNTERNPKEHVAMIRKVFLDYTTKLQSPEFLLPSSEPKNKEVFIQGFEQTRKQLRNLTETKNLDQTFTDFSFPTVGELTGWEWICFAVCHSKRHIRQMKIIAEKLKASAPTIE